MFNHDIGTVGNIFYPVNSRRIALLLISTIGIVPTGGLASTQRYQLRLTSFAARLVDK